MLQFSILFYANYTILATQKGELWHHGSPQNTPLYARYIDDVFAGFDDAKPSSSFLNILNSIGVARGGGRGLAPPIQIPPKIKKSTTT